jgi:hypothetical protein
MPLRMLGRKIVSPRNVSRRPNRASRRRRMISTLTTTTRAANEERQEFAPRTRGARRVGEQASLPRAQRMLHTRPARQQRRLHPSPQPRRQRPPPRLRRAPPSKAARALRTRRHRRRWSGWIRAPPVRGRRGAALRLPLRLRRRRRRRRQRRPRLRARARQQPRLRPRSRRQPRLHPGRRQHRPQARRSAGGCKAGPIGPGVDKRARVPLPEQEN